MVDDVIVNKVATIERCLARVREEYGSDERNLRDNLTRQDSIILNLQAQETQWPKTPTPG